MKTRKGAATLYVVIGLVVFLGIMTYVFTRTSSLEIDILTYFGEIKEKYEENLTDSKKTEILQQLQNDINQLDINTL